MRTRSAAVCLAALLTMSASRVPAQEAHNAAQSTFHILDNSFLVEEAFNQEPGVFQNIFTFTREHDAAWAMTFTQEWPAPRTRHQLSFTVPVSHLDRGTGLGDLAINYRLQALTETAGRPSFSPRVTVLLPTGDAATGLGAGATGWQVNLPFSKRQGVIYFHWNAGFTLVPRAGGGPDRVSLFSPSVAGSAIWQVTPMFDLMLELVEESSQDLDGGGGRLRTNQFTISPGFRRGWNAGDSQIVIGAGAPITKANGETDAAVLTYFSYEARFKR